MTALDRMHQTCARKIAYPSWDEAEKACLQVWKDNPRQDDVNPCAPYPCPVAHPLHYHIGHIRTRTRNRRP